MSYRDMNISKYVVSAICGNWWRESGIDPAVWESLIPCAWDFQYDYTGKGGYGLGQWTNVGTSHGRLWNLYRWCSSNNYSMTDGDGQLEYMLVEDYWTNSSQSRLGYTSLAEFLQSDSTNLEDLVWDFLANWEGVAGDHFDERLEYAEHVLEFINDHMNDGVTYTWIYGNRYLSESERYNNAMVVFNYMSKGSFPRHKQGMPLWMMLIGRRYKVTHIAELY